MPHLERHAELHARLAYRGDDPVTIGEGGRERFLTQHMLAGGRGQLDQVRVAVRLAGHEHGGHARVVDDVAGVAPVLHAIGLRGLPAALHVLISVRDQLDVREALHYLAVDVRVPVRVA